MRKDIKGYEGLYQIDEFGTVVKIAREAKDKRDGFYTREVEIKGRYVKDKKGEDSYRIVQLWKDAKSTNFLVHILVYETFSGNIKPKNMDIDHIDGNRKNNHIDNLEVVSRSENNIRAYKLGFRGSGHDNPVSKTSKEDLDKVFELIANNYSKSYACKLTGVSFDTIKKIGKGISYKDRTDELNNLLSKQDRKTLIKEPRGKYRDKQGN